MFLFALAPALAASRRDASHALAAGRGVVSSRSAALGRSLIACEMALALLLLAGSALMLESVLNMKQAPLGFDPDHLYRAYVALPADRFASSTGRIAFDDELRRRLNALSGVEGAALATAPPPYGLGNARLDVAGRARSQAFDIGENRVSAEYFRVMKIAFLGGRAFDEHDSAGSDRVAIVNRALVRAHFGDADPLGRQIRIISEKEGPWLTVIGVVADEKRPELFHEMSWVAHPVVYSSLAQDPDSSIGIVVRALPGFDFAHQVRETIARIDPAVAMSQESSMRDALGAYLRYPAFRALVVTSFALLALLLASIGLAGVLAQFVAQRTREIGVRIAVGAARRDILELLARRGGVPVLAGLMLGVAATLALTRFMSNLLYGVRPDDPRTLIAVSLLLLAAAPAGMLIAARRAIRVDPMAALRNE